MDPTGTLPSPRDTPPSTPATVAEPLQEASETAAGAPSALSAPSQRAPKPKRKHTRKGPKVSLTDEQRAERVAIRSIVLPILRPMRGKVPTTELRKAAVALTAFVARVGADLGGVRGLSSSQRTILGLAAAQSLPVNLMAGVLSVSPALAVNRGRGGASPLMRDFTAAADRLKGLLSELGMERKAAAGPTLAEYLAAKMPGDGKAGGRP